MGNQARQSGGVFSSGPALLVLGAFIISFSPVFVRVSAVDPTTAGVYRTLFGGLGLALLVKLKDGALWPGWRNFRLCLLAGFSFSLDLLCWHHSILYVGPGLATILGNFQVFFMAVAGFAFFKERLGLRFCLSVALALAGLFLLVGVEKFQADLDYRNGVIFGLLTAVAYVGYLLAVRRMQTGTSVHSQWANMAMVSLCCAAFMTPMVVILGESFAIPSAADWLYMSAYGLFCQALGWVLISISLPKVSPGKSGLILLSQPTCSFIWDILFFARPCTMSELAGAALALFAIYLGSRAKK